MTTTTFLPRETYDAPNPTTNTIQETMRWLPHGVRMALVNIPTNTTPIDDLPHSIRTFLQDQGMTFIPTRGTNIGKLHLNDTGRRVRKTLQSRLQGKDAR